MVNYNIDLEKSSGLFSLKTQIRNEHGWLAGAGLSASALGVRKTGIDPPSSICDFEASRSLGTGLWPPDRASVFSLEVK